VAATTVRKLSGKRLRVNLRTKPAKRASQPGLDEGYLQVELLDNAGQPLDGFARSDCSPIKGDHQDLQVVWRGGKIAPARACKARFYLKRAFLYGFEAADDRDAQDSGPP
jgi:hypothetical protein